MTGFQKHFGSLTLLLSCAAAQNTAGIVTLQTVTAAQEKSGVRIEITLSAPVQPAAAMAIHPDRIVLDFPETTSDDRARNIAVNVNGVRRIRTGPHSRIPLITRLVIDLDQRHPYTLKSEGSRITLLVGPPEIARPFSQGAPVAATSGNLLGVFRKRKRTPSPGVDNDSTSESNPTPPVAISGTPFEPPATDSSSSHPLPPVPLAPPEH